MEDSSSKIVVCSPLDVSIKITKWKVRDGYPVSSGNIIFLYHILNESEKDIKRFKSTKCGVVKKRLYKEGDIIEAGKPVIELSECSHTTVIKDMCADCGADLRQEKEGNVSEASVPMIHSVPDLKVTEKLAQKLGQADTERLLEDRKLVLLVDLDQTLIHTTNDNVPNNLKDVYHFQLYGPNSPWYHTRLRPGALQFLSKMDPYYELHICTFGARNYAHTIAQFLDEDGKFFSHRILSRDECFNATSKKDNLKALFPVGDSMVCIIDDREDVWNMASNLIQVKPYHFFQHTGDINAPPGLSKNELDGKGVDFKELMSHHTQKDRKKSESEVKKEDETEKEDETKTEDETKMEDATEKEDENEMEDETKKKDETKKDDETKIEDVTKIDDAEKEDGNKDETKKVDENKMEDETKKEDETKMEEETEKEDGNKDETKKEDETKIEDINKLEDETKLEDENKKEDENRKEDTTSKDETRKEDEAKTEDQIMKDETEEDKGEIKKDETIYDEAKNDNEAQKDKETKQDDPKIEKMTIEDKEPIQKQVKDEAVNIPAKQTPKPATEEKEKDDENLIEIEDPDDYLLYLEHILLKIHEKFYKIYDAKKEIADLKMLIPQVKADVLVGLNLVFSGLVPNNMKLEQSKAYMIAKGLGANVTQEIKDSTTHLVTAAVGTSKFITAKKRPYIKIVAPEWLWTCTERWEHVDERLYPVVSSKPSKMRQPPPHCHSPEHSTNYNQMEYRKKEEPKFMDTINPLMAFSNDDLDEMNNEIDELFENDESSSEEEAIDMENPPLSKSLRKRKRFEEKQEANYAMQSSKKMRFIANPEIEEKIQISNSDLDNDDTMDNDNDDDEESPSSKFRAGEDLPSDLELGSDSERSQEPQDEVDDGEWNMMGQALEREFLGLDD